ncbi:MAG: hypothetical protein S4CHLAM45_04810 [Chlamydiales bacterium]|nr:hypothetical protein [Chlamydiales bacterium]MCH9619978.1 hypothetical protein [Chlamydiales bacterium]MCH9622595.1 hypothetical protein [Chlamydiales bacterium]
MDNVNTKDGVSPELRYASYGVYCAGGSVVVGTARILTAIYYIVKNAIFQQIAKHYESVEQEKNIGERLYGHATGSTERQDAGYKQSGLYGMRCEWWAKQQLVRGLKEISVIGAWVITAQEATQFGKISTWGHTEIEEGLKVEGFHKFWSGVSCC